MTSLTRRELVIGGSAILVTGALSGAAFAGRSSGTFRIFDGHKHKRRAFDDDDHDQKGPTTVFLIAKGQFQTLDFPESTLTQTFGLNNHDEVVGAYVDRSGLTHGFIFQDGHFTSVDDPEGVATTSINGINDRGQIVGFFVATGGNTDGFVGTK